jgi:hypothetical protein
MQNTAAKKRAGHNAADSDCLFANSFQFRIPLTSHTANHVAKFGKAGPRSLLAGYFLNCVRTWTSDPGPHVAAIISIVETWLRAGATVSECNSLREANCLTHVLQNHIRFSQASFWFVFTNS